MQIFNNHTHCHFGETKHIISAVKHGGGVVCSTRTVPGNLAVSVSTMNLSVYQMYSKVNHEAACSTAKAWSKLLDLPANLNKVKQRKDV